MSYLIDTHVLSELQRREPNAAVVAWFASRTSRMLYLSALTLGKIRKGVENVPDRERRLNLLDWLEIELLGQAREAIVRAPGRYKRGRK